MTRDLDLAFIGGSPRTGTTMLQLMLDSLPGVASGPEFDLIPDLVRLREAMVARVAGGRLTAYVDRPRIDAATAAYLRELLGAYAERHGAMLLIEKTPWNVLVAPSLLEMLPSARMLLCVRDPRATVSSMLEVGRRAKALGQTTPWLTHDLSAAIFTVKKCTDAVVRAREAHPTRTLVVPYEELVSRPRELGEQICAFLGVPFDDAFLTPEMRPHEAARVADGAWYPPGTMGRAPDASRSDAWTRELGEHAAARVTAAFASDASFATLGYAITPESPRAPSYQLALARTRIERLAERVAASVTVTGRRVHLLRELARRAKLGGWTP